MELRSIITLQETWQRAVRDHAAFLRDARSAKLPTNEMHKRARIYLLRIDAAFSQLRAAEEYRRCLG